MVLTGELFLVNRFKATRQGVAFVRLTNGGDGLWLLLRHVDGVVAIHACHIDIASGGFFAVLCGVFFGAQSRGFHLIRVHDNMSSSLSALPAVG